MNRNLLCSLAVGLLAGVSALGANAAEGVKLVVPSTESPINYVSMAEIQIIASSGITSFGEVTLSYGDETVELDYPNYGVTLNGPSDNLFLMVGGVSFPDFKELLRDIANAGVESFTVTVSDLEANGELVTTNETNEPGIEVEDGTVTITYLLAAAPEYIASESIWPKTFLKYWPAGDPSGIATLEFTSAIESVGEAKVVMGRVIPGAASEDVFEEFNLDDKVSIDGTTVTIDFTGVQRSCDKSEVTVMVQNVVGVNGLPVDMSKDGTALTLFKYITYSSESSSWEPETPDNPDDPNDPDNPDEPEIKFMEPAAQLTFEIGPSDAAVEIEWPETVSLIDADAVEIPVKYNGETVATLTSTYINLIASGSSEPGIMTMAETGDSGSIMILLLGAANLIFEEGEYVISIPEGIVENEAGEVNCAQEIKVVYAGLAEGVITPESGTIFTAGEDVILTITFDGVVEQNFSLDAPVIVTNYGDYDEILDWEEDVVYIEGNSVIINLGNELPVGTYSVAFREGQVTVDGKLNASIEDYSFTVEEETEGIESIGSLQGPKEVYNLQGVKVNEGNITSGLYIINGKKVMIRK